jgi:hypothetical protein
VQTTKPCSFVDANGRTFTGEARDTYNAPAISLGPDPASPLGLTRPIHVVRIEINGGRGSQGTIYWMATAVQRLDGGATYKLDASRAVEDARARFARLATAEDANLSRKLSDLRQDREARSAAEKRARAQVGASPETQRSPVVTATDERYRWDADTRRLRVVLVHERRAVWMDSYKMPPHQRQCPQGAPCLPPPPFELELVDLHYGVEVAATYEYDTEGTLVETRPLPVRERK